MNGGTGISDPFGMAGVDYLCESGAPSYTVYYGWSLEETYSIRDVETRPGDVITAEVRWNQNAFVASIEALAEAGEWKEKNQRSE